MNPVACPICSHDCLPLDVVDFNKSCEERRGRFLELSGIPIYYFLCSNSACRFCFAPEFSTWQKRDFAEKIYNDDYVRVDPEYLEVRPRNISSELNGMFGGYKHEIRHLDFGGGSGLMSQLLREAQWQSISSDPFAGATAPAVLGQFNLITAVEVFEHVQNVRELIDTLSLLLAPKGVVLFKTLVSDGHIAPNRRIDWWYASPRNGHISLFTRKSLALLGARNGLNFLSLSDTLHAYWKQLPFWASQVIRPG